MFDRLLDGMDIVLREQLQFVEGFLVWKGTIGIKTEFYLMEGESVADAFDEIEAKFEEQYPWVDIQGISRGGGPPTGSSILRTSRRRRFTTISGARHGRTRAPSS